MTFIYHQRKPFQEGWESFQSMVRGWHRWCVLSGAKGAFPSLQVLLKSLLLNNYPSPP